MTSNKNKQPLNRISKSQWIASEGESDRISANGKCANWEANLEVAICIDDSRSRNPINRNFDRIIGWIDSTRTKMPRQNAPPETVTVGTTDAVVSEVVALTPLRFVASNAVMVTEIDLVLGRPVIGLNR